MLPAESDPQPNHVAEAEAAGARFAEWMRLSLEHAAKHFDLAITALNSRSWPEPTSSETVAG